MSRELTLRTETLGEDQILGLRTAWITGEASDGAKFELDSSAGFGGTWMSLTITFPDGTRRTETVDMRNVLLLWVREMRKEMEAKE